MSKGVYQHTNPWETVNQRFFSKVKKTKTCWQWTGYVKPNHYGMISLGRGKINTASRMSYIIHKGKVPNGKIIMHLCDNKACVNPDHLEAGTYTQNLKDAYKRGLRGDSK